MGYYPFDSRNPLYRSVFGAVAANSPLRLRLLLHKDARVHTAYIKLTRDGGETKEIPLEAREWLEDYRFYDCTLTLEEGLYWYSFFYDSDYGRMFVTKNKESLGTVSPDGACWQQTVYKADFETPDRIKGGIIYQIFPDRFYNSGKEKSGVPADRFIQTDWTAQPAFRQDGQARSLGNDYYGGDLAGITEKLPYLASLGVSCIYLNPIFEAHSNHRYNTADYKKIDPSLGNDRDLETLCREAEKYGIFIMLDGVFSHTGDDSVYFNKYGRYESLGAAQSQESPYIGWYNFRWWPHKYSSWWGVPSLPETQENSPAFTEFITGEHGVLTYWMERGVKGWRLDVADELPDEFLDKIRLAIKKKDPSAFLLGEVWEDATNKISYGYRRKYLRGDQLDSVMNYPLAEAIIAFVKGGNADKLLDVVLTQCENYPPQTLCCLMNHIGSHDTARILTRLGCERSGNREWQANDRLSSDERTHAKRLLRLAAALQYTLPGIPSLYYGDEVGMEGHGDPFCRGSYPWGNEDVELLEFYRSLGKIRRENAAFKTGRFVPLYSDLGYVSFLREGDGDSIFVTVNRWHEEAEITLPEGFSGGRVLMGEPICGNTVRVPGFGISIIKK